MKFYKKLFRIQSAVHHLSLVRSAVVDAEVVGVAVAVAADVAVAVAVVGFGIVVGIVHIEGTDQHRSTLAVGWNHNTRRIEIGFAVVFRWTVYHSKLQPRTNFVLSGVHYRELEAAVVYAAGEDVDGAVAMVEEVVPGVLRLQVGRVRKAMIKFWKWIRRSTALKPSQPERHRDMR